MVAVGVPFSLLGRAAADSTGVTTHKKGMLSHKEKAQAKKKANAAGKPSPSSHIEINKLEESFEPKVEAVAVMRHAIHENEALRKLAKKQMPVRRWWPLCSYIRSLTSYAGGRYAAIFAC